jgi:hypothetical protein
MHINAMHCKSANTTKINQQRIQAEENLWDAYFSTAI